MKARRGEGAPLRRGFVTSGADLPPLAQIMSGRSAGRGGGGRGGKTRLALLLSLIWVLASKPHSSNRPARFWAELIGLEDPESKGARAVRASLAELEKRGFVVVEPGEEGHPPTVRLLTEDMSGKPYTIPGSPEAGGHEAYIRVPEILWTGGGIERLSGPALAMYLVVLTLYRSSDDERRMWISPASFKERYGLGESTRKTGLRELVEAGVLLDFSESVDAFGETGNRTYQRKTYLLNDEFKPKTRQTETSGPVHGKSG